MLLLVFVMDFATIALATDRVHPSKAPETWAIGSFIRVSVVLGIAMAAETLFLLWIGWSRTETYAALKLFVDNWRRQAGSHPIPCGAVQVDSARAWPLLIPISVYPLDPARGSHRNGFSDNVPGAKDALATAGGVGGIRPPQLCQLRQRNEKD